MRTASTWPCGLLLVVRKASAGETKASPREGALDEVHESGRQVGEVAEGAVLDLAVVAVGLAQQVADIGLAAVLADDLGHMSLMKSKVRRSLKGRPGTNGKARTH